MANEGKTDKVKDTLTTTIEKAYHMGAVASLKVYRETFVQVSSKLPGYTPTVEQTLHTLDTTIKHYEGLQAKSQAQFDEL